MEKRHSSMAFMTINCFVTGLAYANINFLSSFCEENGFRGGGGSARSAEFFKALFGRKVGGNLRISFRHCRHGRKEISSRKKNDTPA